MLAMKDHAFQHIAGIPFVAQVPFSHDDLESLNWCVDRQKDKVKTGKVYLYVSSFLLVVVVWLMMNDNVQIVWASIGCGFLILSILLCSQFTWSCYHKQKRIERDLKQGCVRQYEGVITDVEHWLVKSKLLKNDFNQVQKVEVLGVSGEIHRIN